jgi:putative flippase GtrA
MSERLKIVRSPVRSRPQPPLKVSFSQFERLVLMKTRFKVLKDKYFEPSMLRWSAVGITTTVIDYLLFISLYGPINSVFLANLIAASVATSLNYYTHHRWTFKSEQNHSRSGFKYLLNLTFWWFISTSIIQALVILNIDPKIAKIAPLILIVPINYFVLNKLVFKKKS